MNHVEVGQPFRRDAREPVVCMHCGQKKPPNEFSKARAHTDEKQSWCKQCQADYKKNIDRVGERIAAADIVERRQVLVQMHEAGREHLSEHCPLCAEVSK